jgi:predicted SnoaL-like aldol condensation-catalyzing enzyme
MSLQEQNKAFFAKALDDFFNKRDLASADRNYLPTYVQHNEQVAAMAKAQGVTPVEGMKGFFRTFFEAFPDYRVEIEFIGGKATKYLPSSTGKAPTGKTLWAFRQPARRSKCGRPK